MTGPNPASIQQIVAELQTEVRRYQPDSPAEPGAAEARAPGGDGAGDSDALARVRLYQHVNSHLPIGWPDMPPGILPKLRAYAQKIVRRLLRWYINPLVDQQNLFNTAVTEALSGLSLRMERQEQLLRELQRKIERQESAHNDGREG
jgi:hypothetical protein